MMDHKGGVIPRSEVEVKAPIVRIAPKPTIEEKIKEDCAVILRRALAKVEAGEINGCVLLLMHSADGHWSDDRSGFRDFSGVIGRLTITMQSMINTYLKENCEDPEGLP